MDGDWLITAIPEVVRRYGLKSVAVPKPVLGGTLNWNFRIETDRGPWFLRRYRDDLENDRILSEHGLTQWVAARGFPVPQAVKAPAGSTVTFHESGRWALFPWAEGTSTLRGELKPEQARALGRMHGRIQAALARHPQSEDARLAMRWDKQQSLGLLEQVVAAAEREAAEPWVVAAIRRQRDVLAELEVLPPEAFGTLPCQMLHGDFHDGQVLWTGNDVSAVLDWDMWHCDPRVWELVRSLAFSQLLDTSLLSDYLGGYREFVQLSEKEVQLGLKLWWQSRVVGLWVWAAYFLQGNRRVKDFFVETATDLERAGNEQWKAALAERFVHAACR